MKKLLCTLALVVGCYVPKGVEYAETSESAADATRTIMISMDGYEVGGGTAWVVASGSDATWYMTAGHVCDPEFTYSLVSRDGTKEPNIRVVKDDDTVDLCLLEGAPSKSPVMHLSHEEPSYGDWLSYVGSPDLSFGGGVAPVFHGQYTGLDTEMNLYAASMPGYGGSSGSAVVNAKGEVIGVLVRGDARFPMLVYLVTLPDIRQFIEDAGHTSVTSQQV